MSKYIAYLRVSTDKQSIENQKHKILDYAYSHDIKISKFIEIEVSSRKEQRLRLIEELFESLEENDTVIFTELSRLGRNMLEILNLIERFNQAKIKIIFVNQPELSTANNALSKLMYSIYGYFSETEREIISIRTKQGLEVARAKGKLIGRQKGQLVKSKYDVHRGKIEELYKMGLPVQRIVEYINIGTQSSLRRYIKSRKIEGAAKNKS
jgi:DNA invertase Pin-like site-specific DNA recombinase